MWKLTNHSVWQWKSTNDFALLVSFSLQFPDALVGNFSEGDYDYFLHFSRSSAAAAYTVSWPSSP